MSESKSNNLAKRATYELRQKVIYGGLQGGTRLYEVALSFALASISVMTVSSSSMNASEIALRFCGRFSPTTATSPRYSSVT